MLAVNPKWVKLPAQHMAMLAVNPKWVKPLAVAALIHLRHRKSTLQLGQMYRRHFLPLTHT